MVLVRHTFCCHSQRVSVSIGWLNLETVTKINIDLWQSSLLCSLFPLPPGLTALNGRVPEELLKV